MLQFKWTLIHEIVNKYIFYQAPCPLPSTPNMDHTNLLVFFKFVLLNICKPYMRLDRFKCEVICNLPTEIRMDLIFIY